MLHVGLRQLQRMQSQGQYLAVFVFIISRFGYPIERISHRVFEFLNGLIKGTLNGSERSRKPIAYHPQTNGLDEDMNGVLIKILSLLIHANMEEWDVS